MLRQAISSKNFQFQKDYIMLIPVMNFGPDVDVLKLCLQLYNRYIKKNNIKKIYVLRFLKLYCQYGYVKPRSYAKIINLLKQNKEPDTVINEFKVAMLGLNLNLEQIKIKPKYKGSFIKQLTYRQQEKKEQISDKVEQKLYHELEQIRKLEKISTSLLVDEINRKCKKCYINISTTDLLLHIKNGKTNKRVLKMIELFNKLCYWVPTEIIKTPLLVDQRKKINKFLKIGFKLKKTNNFFGLAAIYTGLSNQSISRLTYLWPYDIQQQLDKLGKLIDIRSNYSNYRKAVRNLKKSSYYIPFFPVIQSDIVHALECKIYGCNKTFDREAFDILATILNQFEMNKTNLPPNCKPTNYTIKYYFKHLIVWPSEDRLHNYSLTIKPIKLRTLSFSSSVIQDKDTLDNKLFISKSFC